MGFLNNLINGISLGSIYAVIALGYTLVYGIAKMLNFAHGDVIMVGGYVIFTCMTTWGLNSWLSIVLAVIACTLLGIVIEKVAYKPLRQATSLAVLITAIGVSYFLQNIALLIFGEKPVNFTSVVNVYKCCNTSGIETGRWSTHNLRYNNCYISGVRCDHGCTDAFYQENQSRSGNACSI